MSQMMLFWKLNKNVIFINLILLGVELYLWLGSEKTKEFGLNFFTEMLGVAITVFIIDSLIQKREEYRNLPKNLAAYKDICLYSNRYTNFWLTAFRESVPEEDPETIEQFFSVEGMTKILQYLDIDSQPNVTPPRKWSEWIISNVQEFKENGNKILNRYSDSLDPEIFGHIHQLTESRFNFFLLTTLGLSINGNLVVNIYDIKKLRSYSIEPLIEDYTAIISLIDWCEQSYGKLKKYDSSIMRIAEYIPEKNKKMPPKSIIDKKNRA